MNLTDDLCDPCAFMDTLAPDTAKRATTLVAQKPRRPLDGLPQVMAQLVEAVEQCRQQLLDSDGPPHLIFRCEMALAQFDKWRAGL